MGVRWVLVRLPRLQRQEVFRDEVEAVAAVEGEPRPQRVVALGPEPRMLEKPHDVAGLQCRGVEAPALRVEDISALVGLASLAGVVGLIGHVAAWCAWRVQGFGAAVGPKKATSARLALQRTNESKSTQRELMNQIHPNRANFGMFLH